MGNHFWWILDVCVIAIIVYVIHSNAKRGATKVLILGIGYIFASLVASLVASAGAESVYESIALRSNISSVESVNEKVDLPTAFKKAIDNEHYGLTCDRDAVEKILYSDDGQSFDEGLYDYVCSRIDKPVFQKTYFLNSIRNAFISAYGEAMDKKMPAYVRKSFEKAVLDDSNVMRNMVRLLYDRKKSARESATEIERLFARTPTIEVVRMFLYLILFSVVMVIAAVISAILQNKLFLNLTKSKERLFGGILGIMEVVAMLVMFTIFVRLMVLLGGGHIFCFSDESISKTVVFHFLYNNLPTLI